MNYYNLLLIDFCFFFFKFCKIFPAPFRIVHLTDWEPTTKSLNSTSIRFRVSPKKSALGGNDQTDPIPSLVPRPTSTDAQGRPRLFALRERSVESERRRIRQRSRRCARRRLSPTGIDFAFERSEKSTHSAHGECEEPVFGSLRSCDNRPETDGHLFGIE